MYVSVQEYHERSAAPLQTGDLAKFITRAERDIDSLTFNRIRAAGIDTLTEFQRDLVKQAVVEQVDFRAAYADLLENPLASYAINGVSMSWDSTKIKQVSGVYTTTYVYGLLQQTGLTYRGVR